MVAIEPHRRRLAVGDPFGDRTVAYIGRDTLIRTSARRDVQRRPQTAAPCPGESMFPNGFVATALLIVICLLPSVVVFPCVSVATA
jgi:hypothetical protein